MKSARISIDRYNVLSEIDPRLYGSFIEHLGRAVYEGIYQSGHKTADADGFRGDTLSLVRNCRYPPCAIPAAILSPDTAGRTASGCGSSVPHGWNMHGI